MTKEERAAKKKAEKKQILFEEVSTALDHAKEFDGVKLDKTFKKNWLKALRSGKYEQGVKKLRAINSKTKAAQYCCLGVACHVAGASGITDKEFIENQSFSKIKSINKVPKILHGYEGIARCMSQLNDSGNFNFNEIADIIETYL